jgi:hypothetical protein
VFLGKEQKHGILIKNCAPHHRKIRKFMIRFELNENDYSQLFLKKLGRQRKRATA